jgi:hypothetical protein
MQKSCSIYFIARGGLKRKTDKLQVNPLKRDKRERERERKDGAEG